MASGYVTGYQHELIDTENLTKEKFAELCDKWFYHLDRYDMKSYQEFEDYRKKEIEKYDNEIAKNQEELAAIKSASIDKLKEDYGTYVKNTLEANERYRETFKVESERMKVVREYAASFTPHLDYIWRDLKDPELFQLEVTPYREWKDALIHSAEHSIKFYGELKERAEERENPHSEQGQRVQDYEEKKKKFLANE
jgi:hypothetical protein